MLIMNAVEKKKVNSKIVVNFQDKNKKELIRLCCLCEESQRNRGLIEEDKKNKRTKT